ncbi:MAG TPA: CRISPR-associated endonuclease Cas2 [Thermoanaerobaculia bacterium]|jgi:CRISPR-associated protein Cas2
MKYVIAYDLESDAVRARVAEVLLACGERVQKSVFECTLAPEELDGVVERLRREIAETPGNVRIYRLCFSCLQSSFGIGEVRTTVDEQNCVIL